MAELSGFRLLASCVAAATVVGCGRPAPPRPTKLIMAIGAGQGTLYTIGTALGAIYSHQIPGVASEVTYASGRSFERNVDAIQDGVVDLALADSETTYVAYKKGTAAQPQPHNRIRAIAVMFPTVVHVFARRESGIRSIADLRGKRINVGPRGSDSELAAALILGSYGLGYGDMDTVFASTSNAAAQVRARQLDAVFYYLPFSHQAVINLTTHADVRLIPIARERIASIQETTQRSRFLKSTIVPAGTYRGQDTDVMTLGEELLLLCRENLPEQLVYDMTRVLFESVPQLAKAHPAALQIDPDRGPLTTIPLHPGAAWYNRERELPK
jgi:uncharacterized protein